MSKQLKRAQYPPVGRFDLAYQEVEEILSLTEAELEMIYGEAYRELLDEAEAFMNRYKELDDQKRKALYNGKISKEEYQTWRQNQLMTDKYHRAMVETVTAILASKNAVAYSVINGYIPEVYAINGNFITYQIQKNVSANIAFTIYNEQAVEKLIREKPDLLPHPSVDIPKDKRWNKQNINNAIMQGIIQGDTTDAIAMRIANVSTMNKNQAVRTAATAMTSAQNAGRMDNYRRAQALGVKNLQHQWLSTLDGHTRASHRAIDGEIRDIDDEFSNGLLYPGDPHGEPAEVWNCRCVTIPYFKGESEWNGAEGRASSLPEDMTYEEWQHANGTEPFFKKAKNVNDDMSMYEKYRELYEKHPEEFNAKVPNTFRKFQKLKYEDDFHWRMMIQDARRARAKK